MEKRGHENSEAYFWRIVKQMMERGDRGRLWPSKKFKEGNWWAAKKRRDESGRLRSCARVEGNGRLNRKSSKTKPGKKGKRKLTVEGSLKKKKE